MKVYLCRDYNQKIIRAMITVLENIDLRPYNTMRVGAKAAMWIEFDSLEDAPAAIETAKMATPSGKYMIMGGGSNILFCNDYSGAIVHPAVIGWEAKALGNGKMEITAGAGVEFDNLIASTCRSGLWGLENLSLIPGSVGGAAVQNAGAYGVETGDYISEIRAWDIEAEKFVVIKKESLDYGYRTSLFKKAENAGKYIVLEVSFILSAESCPKLDYGPLKDLESDSVKITPDLVRQKIVDIRNSKLPKVSDTGSAGSFFKNPVLEKGSWAEFISVMTANGIEPDSVPHFVLPDGSVKIPAAWLIDKCGWKGKTLGNAAVWSHQPLIIVNATGKASGSDIVALEKAIVEDFIYRLGIKHVPEVGHV